MKTSSKEYKEVLYVYYEAQNNNTSVNNDIERLHNVGCSYFIRNMRISTYIFLFISLNSKR